jgi:hypothetical protein
LRNFYKVEKELLKYSIKLLENYNIKTTGLNKNNESRIPFGRVKTSSARFVFCGPRINAS